MKDFPSSNSSKIFDERQKVKARDRRKDEELKKVKKRKKKLERKKEEKLPIHPFHLLEQAVCNVARQLKLLRESDKIVPYLFSSFSFQRCREKIDSNKFPCSVCDIPGVN